MQPSQSDIQREFEALRDIRRRSSSQGGPGALILDPDLPNTQPPSSNAPLSPQVSYWNAAASPSSPSSNEGSESDHSSTLVGEDSFHLFWVPASLHPELAPGEFQSFLKEHTRESGAALSRSGSGSSSLGRKRSMLSRQYKPHEGDGVEREEKITPLRRNKSGIYAYPGPQLSISDLEKLEQLAEEASKSDDPTKLRSVLRRSLSMNVSPSVIDQIDMPDTGDDVDVPIIIPPPNQILRRTARTKIRKPGLVGDGGGHRFASSRKRSGRGTPADEVSQRERSSSDHGPSESETIELPVRKQSIPSYEGEPEDDDSRKRDTFTEESFIYDAYATDDHDDSYTSRSPPTSAHSPLLSPPVTYSEPSSEPEPIPDTGHEHIREPQVPSTSPVPSISQLHHPQPQHHRGPAEQGSMPRTPSPDAPSPSASPDHFRRTDSRSSVDSHAPSFLNSHPPPQHGRKEKEKKGILKGWGGSKGSKKGDEKARVKDQKDKDPGFLSSIFGGSKKKHEEHPANSGLGGGAGPATAAALLGASKSSKNHTPQLSPQLGNPYARYPIHVERAVYRLSHIKLANPRRPLYEQVLISNLMFWYLGVINKTQQANQTAGQASSPPASGSQAHTPDAAEKERLEQDQREQHEREEKERMEREKQEREQKERMEREHERERIEQKKETRKGSLTKPSAAPGRRAAEMPVKGPQYGLQHQVIEQEYGSGNGYGQIPPGIQPAIRPSSAPPGTAPANYPGYHKSGSPSQQQQHHPQPVRTQPMQQHSQQSPPPQQHHNPNYYYNNPSVPAPQRPASAGRSAQGSPHLPPGAMPPYSMDQNWLNQAPQVGRSHSGSSSQQPIQSMPDNYGYPQARPPPQQHHFLAPDASQPVNPNGNAKLPNRSLSATAAPPSRVQEQNLHPHPNGGHVLRKKSPSATAVPPADWSRNQRQAAGMVGGAGEDEDVPLSVWQHQQQQQQQQQWRR